MAPVGAGKDSQLVERLYVLNQIMNSSRVVQNTH